MLRMPVEHVFARRRVLHRSGWPCPAHHSDVTACSHHHGAVLPVLARSRLDNVRLEAMRPWPALHLGKEAARIAK